MKDDPLPNDDNYCRYCSGGSLDGERVTQTAFFLKGQEFVSVNWLEFLKLSSRKDEIEAVRKALKAKNMTLRHTGRFAVLNVGQSIRYVQDKTRQLISLTHQPEVPVDPSHSGLFYPASEQALTEFIATRIAECVYETHRAAE